MKLFAIKSETGKYLPIPDTRRNLPGTEPVRYTHTSKAACTRHLNAMKSLGVWLQAEVVEIP